MVIKAFLQVQPISLCIATTETFHGHNDDNMLLISTCVLLEVYRQAPTSHVYRLVNTIQTWATRLDHLVNNYVQIESRVHNITEALYYYELLTELEITIWNWSAIPQ